MKPVSSPVFCFCGHALSEHDTGRACLATYIEDTRFDLDLVWAVVTNNCKQRPKGTPQPYPYPVAVPRASARRG